MRADLFTDITCDLAQIAENSFRDFHVKGFDYICVKRSPTETVKLYFFDGDVTRLPEVVSPHDHRYDFHTSVLAGASENVWFSQHPTGIEFNRFDYLTPLNGGSGFAYAGTERLAEVRRLRRLAGHSYSMRAEELHTIRIVENETVLMLRQFEDVVPVGVPTSTFCLGNAPTLDGLYRRFTEDEIVSQLRILRERTGLDLLNRNTRFN